MANSFVPAFKLYKDDGLTLQYTFPLVQATNAPQSMKKSTEVKGIRGIGSIIVPGSDEAWELYLKIMLWDVDYIQVTVLIDELEADVALHTPYYLKFDKSISETYSYKVMRVKEIQYEDGLRLNSQIATIRLLVNSW
jgi:hypothetical protein